MSKESKDIQIQPEWQALKEKAEQRALQFMNDPDLDEYGDCSTS